MQDPNAQIRQHEAHAVQPDAGVRFNDEADCVSYSSQAESYEPVRHFEIGDLVLNFSDSRETWGVRQVSCLHSDGCCDLAFLDGGDYKDCVDPWHVWPIETTALLDPTVFLHDGATVMLDALHDGDQLRSVVGDQVETTRVHTALLDISCVLDEDS